MYQTSRFSLCLLLWLTSLMTAHSANPYVNIDSKDPLEIMWTGSEWGDGIPSSSEAGRPLPVMGTLRRLANMPWGQMVRFTFVAKNGRDIPPLHLLVRDEVILDLASDDIEYVIGTVAAMPKPPHYDPDDVVATITEGTEVTPSGSGQAEITTAGNESTYLWQHPSGHFRKLVWRRGVGLVEYSMGQGARADGFRLTFGPPSQEDTGLDLLSTEKLGTLRIGLPEGEALTTLGQPAKVTQATFLQATGEWYRELLWPNQGLRISMGGRSEDGPWAISSIQADAPCRLTTAAGIRIGSLEADVQEAYAEVRDAENSESGKIFVAGSIYGGIMFEFTAGVVTRIFFGAGAE